MKILEVCPKFHHSVASGSTKGAYYISQELARRGHSVAVYTSDMKDKYTRMDSGIQEIDGILVHRFRSIGTIATREMKIFVTPAIIRKARNEIRSFDVIHIHEYRGFQGTAIHHFARKYSIPYVLQARGSLPRIMAWQGLKRIYDVLFGYRLLRHASKVIALTRTEAQQYRDMGVPEEKIAIIPNGIDLSEYGNLPPKGSFKKNFNIDDDEKIVLYLGRIHRIKGVDILLKAFSRIAKTLKDVKLAIVGSDDGYLLTCKNLTRRLDLSDRVLFTGPLYGKAKLETYVDGDVFVLPSRYETFPNVILEAYACSKPVIASNVESISDIVIHGKTGLLFQAGNVQKLTEMITYMLVHSEEARNMGHRARKLEKEKFSIDKVVDSLEVLYEEILKGK